jgi:hypothetical protein
VWWNNHGELAEKTRPKNFRKLTPEERQERRQRYLRNAKWERRLVWIVFAAIVVGLCVGVRACGRYFHPENFHDGQNLLKEKYTNDYEQFERRLNK